MAGKATAPSTRSDQAKLSGNGSGHGSRRLLEIQRARLIGAMAEVACERGAGGATVANVVKRAGVSRRTFYEIFEDREDCFRAAFDEAIACASRYAMAGYDPRAKWAARIRAALEGSLRFLDDEPVMGRIVVVESLNAGTAMLHRRRDAVACLVAEVDAGRKQRGAGSSDTALTAEGVVGGVASVIHGRMLASGCEPLVGLANSLMSMVVLPYLGPAAARRELGRPVARATPLTPAARGNPLKDLDMRLTYRTVRVLAAVAAHPRSSNRVIGDASGVGDQGQISKLLARLQKLGLVENVHAAQLRGAPNAWNLTGHGEEVANVLAAEVTHA